MGIDEDGMYKGRLKATGIRPAFSDHLENFGIQLVAGSLPSGAVCTMMRRLLTLNVLVAGFMVATIGPALAQDSRAARPADILLFVGAVAAGLALFLLIMIVFGPNKAVERDLSGRLGTYASQTEKTGKLQEPVLRRFASKAESVAERRGMTGMIETALEQANMPISPGEAIAGAIGVAIVMGLLGGSVHPEHHLGAGRSPVVRC